MILWPYWSNKILTIIGVWMWYELNCFKVCFQCSRHRSGVYRSHQTPVSYAEFCSCRYKNSKSYVYKFEFWKMIISIFSPLSKLFFLHIKNISTHWFLVLFTLSVFNCRPHLPNMKFTVITNFINGFSCQLLLHPEKIMWFRAKERRMKGGMA